MKRLILGVILASLLATTAFSQQPNGVRATMLLNGVDGPPFPITGIQFPRGTNQVVLLSGLPNSPFIVGGSSGLRAAGVPYPQGLVDIDFVNYATVWNGTINPAYTLDGTGQWTATLPIPSTVALNQTRAFQGVVSDFTAASGATMTAASQVIIAPGITTTSFSLGDDDSANFNLQPYGFTLPFYTSTYSNVWVNSNGSLSFNSGNTDYIPSTAAFLAQQPRVAGFWTDLSPPTGGTIRMIVDQTTALPFIRCEFNNVAEFSIGTPHTFSMTMYSQIGDIIIAESGFNPQALIATLVGISPGNALSTQQSRNLSSFTIQNYPQGGVQGVANENFHEFFNAGTGWDLAGKTITFTAQGAGTSQGRYLCLTYP